MFLKLKKKIIHHLIPFLSLPKYFVCQMASYSQSSGWKDAGARWLYVDWTTSVDEKTQLQPFDSRCFVGCELCCFFALRFPECLTVRLSCPTLLCFKLNSCVITLEIRVFVRTKVLWGFLSENILWIFSPELFRYFLIKSLKK